VKFFNWIGTMWGGQLSFETPMLWALGFLTTFLFGGLTGMILASPPLDWHVTDSYSSSPTSTTSCSARWWFAMFGGFYFLVVQVHREDVGREARQLHFWLCHRLHTNVLIQHWLGVIGMPRRYARHPYAGWTTMKHRVADRGLHPRTVDVPVRLQRLEDVEVRHPCDS